MDVHRCPWMSIVYLCSWLLADYHHISSSIGKLLVGSINHRSTYSANVACDSLALQILYCPQRQPNRPFWYCSCFCLFYDFKTCRYLDPMSFSAGLNVCFVQRFLVMTFSKPMYRFSMVFEYSTGICSSLWCLCDHRSQQPVWIQLDQFRTISSTWAKVQHGLDHVSPSRPPASVLVCLIFQHRSRQVDQPVAECTGRLLLCLMKTAAAPPEVGGQWYPRSNHCRVGWNLSASPHAQQTNGKRDEGHWRSMLIVAVSGSTIKSIPCLQHFRCDRCTLCEVSGNCVKHWSQVFRFGCGSLWCRSFGETSQTGWSAVYNEQASITAARANRTNSSCQVYKYIAECFEG